MRLIFHFISLLMLLPLFSSASSNPFFCCHWLKDSFSVVAAVVVIVFGSSSFECFWLLSCQFGTITRLLVQAGSIYTRTLFLTRWTLDIHTRKQTKFLQHQIRSMQLDQIDQNKRKINKTKTFMSTITF